MPTSPHSNVLLVSADAVHSLLPPTLISQIGALLELNKIDQAVALAEQHRKGLNRDAIDHVQAQESRFVYQRIGFVCFQNTSFEDAGKHLSTGDLDPRILISYFPDLRGSLFKPGDSVEMFTGIARYLPMAQSVEEIIKNYSPYMVPDTETAPSTAELNRILQTAAHDMLENFLTRYREKRRSGPPQRPPIPELDAVTDTVYAKLLARGEETARLYTFIEESDSIILDEVEPDFLTQRKYNALCKLYERAGAVEKQLDLWSKVADDQWKDDDIPDPLTNMFVLLGKRRDRQLVQKWVVWLTSKDSARAVKLITSIDGGKRSTPEDNIGMLEQLRAVDPSAAACFLEHLILQRRSDDRRLHVEFASLCLDQMFGYISDEAISKLWRAKISGYRKSSTQTSFLSYFVSTTPDSEHKRIRLKTILFLQASALLNMETILSRLKEYSSLLSLEIALAEGKLGHHHSALSILVDDLHDEASAETYCTLGGQVVSPVLAKTIGESCGLQEWASLLEPQPTGRGGGTSLSTAMSSMRATPTKVDEELKKELITILLKVYMNGSEPSIAKASRLLDTQAVNLDALETLTMVPPDWPVNAMSTFLSRSLRRLLHSRHEGMIIKNLSVGQNLEASDKTWAIIREEGAVIEEALEDDGDDSLLERTDEKVATATSPTDAVVGTFFNEKSEGLHTYQANATDINPDEHPTKDEGEHGLL